MRLTLVSILLLGFPVAAADAPEKDVLGVAWEEEEGPHKGIWTRRGTSSVFDARWGSTTAVLMITVEGQAVSIERRGSADGNDCDYEGTLGTDGTVVGTYKCKSGGPYKWKAIIKGFGPPPLAATWDEEETGHKGVWTRRGTSNVYDAVWGKISAVMTVTQTGKKLTIERRNSSDANDCDYTGTISPDGVTIVGQYKCNSGGPYNWRAVMRR
jgi:hypothetical protein